jgi:glycosyltransferase involved in cell wall biosynthesis
MESSARDLISAPPGEPGDGGRNAVNRVAVVISELCAGGAERVVVHLAGTLRRLGLHPTVICLQDKGQLGPDVEAQGVPLVALGSHRGYDVGAVVRLAGTFRRVRPDVINVHDRASLPYVALANRLSGRRPVVLSCHGLLFQAAGRPRWRDRVGRRAVSAVTAVSEQTAEEYARLLDWPGPVDVVPNGVPPMDRDADLGRRLRAELNLPGNVFTFLAVGNIKPEKGFEDLIEAAGLLRRRTDRPFAVLIAGGRADEAYGRRLEASAADPSLGGIVRFLGFRPDTSALYSAADAFVLPSRKEGLPMVLLEAMGAGLPVVATRVGGVPTVVEDPSNGLLVPTATPPELAEAMRRIMADATLRRECGALARQTIARGYSTETMTRRYLEVYGRAAGGEEEGTPECPAKPRVLMLGPLPPLMGGMVTVTDNLRRSALSERCRLMVMNNGKTTPQGRSLVAGIKAQADLLWNVVRCVPRRRVQIVHIHTIQFFGFWRDCVHMAAAKLLGSHVVLHMHGASFDQWAESMGPVRRRLLRLVLEMASGVIVLSHQWQEKLRPYAPGARWHVVPNGVRLPDLVGGSSRPEPSFLFLGDWTKRKGVRDLVSAAALAMRKGFTGMVDLAGFEKEPGQREALDRHVAELGCQARVRVLGALSGKAKEEALAGADCLVLPSYAEGLPMAVLEAMAYGLPVIATRVGAIPEAVTDGQEGFLIEPGDVEALADRLLRLAEDVSLRRRMGQAARRRAETTFSLDAMTEHVMQVYLALLNPRDPAHETDQAPENRCPHPQDAP